MEIGFFFFLKDKENEKQGKTADYRGRRNGLEKVEFLLYNVIIVFEVYSI